MKYIYCLLFISFSFVAWATCPMGDSALKVKNYVQAQRFFEGCALINNDAQSQYALAHLYKDGHISSHDSQLQVLRYLRFAAENGYAPAQYELALYMLEGLKTPEGQALIARYSEQMRQIKIQKKRPLSQMDPMAWMLLAAERAENKWFYTAPPIYVPEAEQFFQKTRLTPEHLREVQAQAAQWKRNKLRHTARQILTEQEWQQFFPLPTGTPEAEALQKALVALMKNRLKDYALYK